jgi:AMMECR1 domain-containing protein
MVSSPTSCIDWYDVVDAAALADISETRKFCSHPDPDHHRAAFRRSVINLTLETSRKNTIEQDHSQIANHLRYAACMRRELRDCFGTPALTSRAVLLSLLVNQAKLYAALQYTRCPTEHDDEESENIRIYCRLLSKALSAGRNWLTLAS